MKRGKNNKKNNVKEKLKVSPLQTQMTPQTPVALGPKAPEDPPPNPQWGIRDTTVPISRAQCTIDGARHILQLIYRVEGAP